ncbi:hypothetical protein [Komarekiella delphini-convector]|nr:hypothetical protein [Komarekiella delphini-convector]
MATKKFPEVKKHLQTRKYIRSGVRRSAIARPATFKTTIWRNC